MSSIITPAQLNNYLGKTLPDGVASLITDGVNQYIETKTSRVWGETKTIIERYNWGRTLWLRHQDVTEITSIKVGWPGQAQTTIDPSGYFLNSLGRVTMLWQSTARPNGSSLYNDYIEVTYSYGSTDVPADLVQAALALASRAYTKSTQGEQEAMQQRVGSFELKFQQKIPGTAPEPGSPEAVVASYATRRV
jgi:uncharacterized phiE125 gp8 family phage protein